jgi:transketolase
LSWPYPPFEIPAPIRAAWDLRARGAAAEASWSELFSRYQAAHPQLARELLRRMSGELPPSWGETAAAAHGEAAKQSAAQATRQSSQAMLNVLTPGLPELIGGSADLTGSNNTLAKASRVISKAEPGGDYIHYGVREFGMTAIMNGLALHGGFIPYGGTFLVFSDYARNAVRLGALMRQRVIHVYTHDSIGLGEDGPTHQPIEHLASLRAMPQLHLWRPCDAVETAVAWIAAVERREGPTALVLTRQGLPQQQRTEAQKANIRRGGYTLIDGAAEPECIVIATGSEIGIAADAVRALNSRGRRVRLVSMPSTEAFDAQDASYRETVLPSAVTRRLAVEAAATQTWWRYVGTRGRVLGIDRFGASGKAQDLFPHFGFTADNVASQVEQLLAG